MIGQRAARVLMQLEDGPKWESQIIGAGFETLRRMEWDRLIGKCGVRRETRDSVRWYQYDITDDGRKALAAWEAAQVRKAERAGRALTDRAPLIATLTNAERRTLSHARRSREMPSEHWYCAPYGAAKGTLAALVSMGMIERPDPLDRWKVLYRLTDLGREVAAELR